MIYLRTANVKFKRKMTFWYLERRIRKPNDRRTLWISIVLQKVNLLILKFCLLNLIWLIGE